MEMPLWGCWVIAWAGTREGWCAAYIPEHGVGAQHCALLNPGRLSGREDKMYSRISQGVGATEVY